MKAILATLAICAMAFRVEAATRYVDLNSPTPSAPYASWETAAHVIQDAVDAADPGDRVLVNDGVYATGGKVVFPDINSITNRVAVDKPLEVVSVNGPEVTIIEGYQLPGKVWGEGAIRCVLLLNGASISGFTLTKGATYGPVAGYLNIEVCGGGVICESADTLITNCVIKGNYAGRDGGGVWLGSLVDCVIEHNGCYDEGGGAYKSDLNKCSLFQNYGQIGGGAYGSVLNDCLLVRNNAWHGGGGVAYSTANSCTIVGNTASVDGGGAYYSKLNNCILYYNEIRYDSWGGEDNYSKNNMILNNCCTTPLPENGVGNISEEPLFVDTNEWSNLRLQSFSPCIDAGSNALARSSLDLDDYARIIDGNFDGDAVVDMGVYEFHVLDVSIQVWPHAINLREKGRLWVVLYPGPNFDAADVDLSSVRFAGAAPEHTYSREHSYPVKTGSHHSAKPSRKSMSSNASLRQPDWHGRKGVLVFSFKTADLNLTPASTEAMLVGRTNDGQLFAGTSSIKIVPDKKRRR